LPVGRERGDTRPHLRADHGHHRACEEQRVQLSVGDLSTADDETSLSV
jgi:hypothetical protein